MELTVKTKRVVRRNLVVALVFVVLSLVITLIGLGAIGALQKIASGG